MHYINSISVQTYACRRYGCVSVERYLFIPIGWKDVSLWSLLIIRWPMCFLRTCVNWGDIGSCLPFADAFSVNIVKCHGVFARYPRDTLETLLRRPIKNPEWKRERFLYSITKKLLSNWVTFNLLVCVNGGRFFAVRRVQEKSRALFTFIYVSIGGRADAIGNVNRESNVKLFRIRDFLATHHKQSKASQNLSNK